MFHRFLTIKIALESIIHRKIVHKIYLKYTFKNHTSIDFNESYDQFEE